MHGSATTAALDARALPLSAYADGDVFERELDTVFRREWILLTRAADLAEPGDHLAIDVVGEPLVVVRGDDGVLRAFVRLCPHRGLPLVPEGRGRLDRFTCGYHLWTFRHDGSLIGAPFARELPGFDPCEHALRAVALEEWLGFVFVNLADDPAPLAPQVADVAAAMAYLDTASMVEVAPYDEVWGSNWKLGVENASESYHHTGTHATTVGPYAPPVGSWMEPGAPRWSLHRTRIIDGPDGPVRSTKALDRLAWLPDDDVEAFRCYTIFPSTVLLFWRASCVWLTFLPLAPDRTRVITGQLLPRVFDDRPDAGDLRAALTERSRVVNDEDRSMLDRLQLATTSRLARPGRLVPQEGVLAELATYLRATTGLPY